MIYLKKNSPPFVLIFTKTCMISLFVVIALCLGACSNPADPEVITVDTHIESISVTAPERRGYSPNTRFSLTGLAVTARYTDGSEVAVNSGYTLSWDGKTVADGNTDITAAPGMKTVSVSWQGKKTAFIIGVFSTTEFTVTSGDELTAFLSHIRYNGNDKSYIITVDGDFEVSTGFLLYQSNTSITVQGSGTISFTGKGVLFNLTYSTTKNLTLYLDGDVVLKGNPDNTDYSNALVGVVWEGNRFVMKGGTLRDNGAGGVFIFRGANFTMEGGTISHNSRGSGAGVYVLGHTDDEFSSFVKTGGIIYGNNATDEDKNTAGRDKSGHAVFWARSAPFRAGYYRDTTLGEGDDISTDNFPANVGQTSGNWTRTY